MVRIVQSTLDGNDKELVDFLLQQLDNKDIDRVLFSIKQLKHYKSPKITDKLLLKLQETKSVQIKLEIIHVLGTKKPIPYLVKTLIEQLLSAEIDVIHSAALSLKRYQKIIITKIRSLFYEQTSKQSKLKIIWLLGQIGTEEDLEILRSIDKEDEMLFYQREDAIKSLKNKSIRLKFKENS